MILLQMTGLGIAIVLTHIVVPTRYANFFGIGQSIHR